ATYYSLLTGKYPYHETESVLQLMYMHCHGPIPDPRSVDPAVPEACSRIVARSMAKEPADRYQSTGEMLADLQDVLRTLSGQPPVALPGEKGGLPAQRAAASSLPVSSAGRRMRWVLAGLLLLALTGLALVLWRPWEKARDGPSRAESEKTKESGETVAVI